jgi:hypothetical protein
MVTFGVMVSWTALLSPDRKPLTSEPLRGHDLGMARAHTHRERPLLRRIMGELAARLPLDAVAWHTPNEDTTGSVVVRVNRAKDGLLPGFPDIGVAYRGIVRLMEVKEGDNDLSDAQLSAHPRLRRAGLTVETVYSLHEALDVVNEWGIPLNEPESVA